jgi:hypothetical protein
MNDGRRRCPRAALLLLVFLLAPVASTRADDSDPDAADDDDDDSVPAWAEAAPAGVDAPQLRNVEPRTRIYLDGSFAQTPDLSSLPYIGGKGRNVRAALGGSLRWRRVFQFDIELPASQATTLDLEMMPNPAIMIDASELHQTALSIGDLRLGAQWTDMLPVESMPIRAGFGLRVRVPTHTTTFQFTNLNDSTLNTYALPYYVHIEPAFLIGGAIGDLSFVMNQGGMLLTGPDGELDNLPVVVPNIYFWDAHYAVAYRVARALALSFEVNTTFQLNGLDPVMFPKVNHVRAVSLIPGVQVHVGRYRVDAIGRLGVTRGADPVGLLGFSGTRSVILRLSRSFD